MENKTTIYLMGAIVVMMAILIVQTFLPSQSPLKMGGLEHNISSGDQVTNSSSTVSSSWATTTDTGYYNYYRICNTGNNIVYVALTSTTTGLGATEGITLSSTTDQYCFEMYPAKFIHKGKIWIKTDKGDSAVSILAW